MKTDQAGWISRLIGIFAGAQPKLLDFSRSSSWVIVRSATNEHSRHNVLYGEMAENYGLSCVVRLLSRTAVAAHMHIHKRTRTFKYTNHTFPCQASVAAYQYVKHILLQLTDNC